ncbi:serine/threonine protein kinase [Arcticibacter tournemirensis]|uniref:non-specific serine/threonine protein kinase n=1 Tax=Arcticibacter tournemirensis TaxID=699437 RepID=A0A5M9H976_9SPHI|nr:protein kinase [Arcticibacter tournemirensis]KAA8482411.1 protein kinase [Arcticibacter tournemirensis]TQM51704.1 serine/threonine protein kinase [Arcticibacter tournemirensis]
MEKAFEISLLSYGPMLQKHDIAYHERNNMLVHGTPGSSNAWILYLSVRTLDTVLLLENLLPLLKENNTPFSLIKNQLLQYQLNAGAFGEELVGKVITLYPKTTQDAVILAGQINALSSNYSGPVVPGAQRIGKILYAPNPEKLPFHIDAEYRHKTKRPAILGRYYVPVQMIRSSAKGDIYKGVNLKGCAFNWCLIKQGKPSALDDHFGRDMKDRLLWQREVLEDIAGNVPTPRFLDFFERRDHSYLVMEYAEGEPLGQKVTELLKGRTWLALNTEEKKQLLRWYLGALEIAGKVHQKGYVHRDISDMNFIILNDNRLCVIDFELSYSLSRQKPAVPFVLGTRGYMAPEQVQYAVPSVKEDVYSLGALLCFILTGKQPAEFIEAQPQKTRPKLQGLAGPGTLSNIVLKCLDPQREKRPEVKELREQVLNYYCLLN